MVEEAVSAAICRFSRWRIAVIVTRALAFLPMNVETLRNVPLFESLDSKAANELCDLLESLDSKAGAVLFRTGDVGDAMYLIEHGKVRICVRAKDGHEVTLTELHHGDFFG